MTNLEFLIDISVDTEEELKEEFNIKEIEKINFENPYVVYGKDHFLSGWGKAEGQVHHQLVICWNLPQRTAVRDKMKEKGFTYLIATSLDTFRNMPHRGTWSVKNANNCPAWNDGKTVEV